MVTSDIDINRAAKVVIKEHGDEAGLYTAMMADEFLERGDVSRKLVTADYHGRWVDPAPGRHALYF